MEAEATARQRLNVTLILVSIFALALFVRAFFAYDLALRDLLVSGGSDAYYYAWINEYIAATGNHLVRDPNLNFPLGMNNPRPPIYAWSVTLSGLLVGYVQGSVELGIWQSFLFSTALWGALTIFPIYFLAKEIFGRRAGLVAAFFLALLPAHIQRTPLSNGDHDALVLFFVVTAFYFYIKALAELKERTWIANWLRPRQIYDGLKGLVLENRRTVLYSVMSGASLAVIALTWQGWAYAPVIVIAYFLVQLVVHKVRNQDSLGILMVFGVALGLALLMAAPYYYTTGFVGTWFDVPLLLYALGLALGVLFTIFHRLPWMLVIPPIILGFGAGLAIAAVYSPTVASTLTSGFGYFVPDKVFETIAEAQPPDFSLVMLSFGMLTSWLSIAGIALMAVHFIRSPKPDYLFTLTWSVAAIYMAMSAVRFIFNASPVFAITSAWLTVTIVQRLGFTEVRKAVAATGGSRFTALRKGVKVRHIAGAFFVAALIMLPNAWSGIDAGVPFEKKRELDAEVYRATPGFLKPPGYQEGLSLHYFGAFGYSLPLRTRYYPTAWEWLSEQDAGIFPISSRPAFLSWWDYGFEAIQEGRHPTVADNFQNGYEYAGHFLLSQSENEGIAVLNTRLLHGDVITGGLEFTPGVLQILESRGLDPVQIKDVILRPAAYVPLIKSDPDRFGEWHARISSRNALVIYLRTILTEKLDPAGQAALYKDLSKTTGNTVRYFAVDSRLVPFSGTNTGILYALAKLTDHRTAELPDLRSIPVDFYRLIAETRQGEFDLDKLPPTAAVTNIRIEYLEPFYNTLLYRIFFGISGSDLGKENNGLPGISGDLRTDEPMHGWMLNHFKLVYRTAYFNPFPQDQVESHPEAWVAMNFFDALTLQDQIQRGEVVGTVDLSSAGNLLQGVIILKYYDGAIMRGRVLSETGSVLQGVRVTVLDELGIPHDFTETGEDGFYEVTLPFGNSHVVASVGDVGPRTQLKSIVLDEKTITVGENQDGVIREDFEIDTAALFGVAFVDLNGNTAQDDGEVGMEGLSVEVRDSGGEVVSLVPTASDGGYEVESLLPGEYTVRLRRGSEQLVESSAVLTLGLRRKTELPIPIARLAGRVTNEFDEPAVGTRLELLEIATGIRKEVIVDATGSYSFDGLIKGDFTLEASQDSRGARPLSLRVADATNITADLTVRPMGTVYGRTLLDFRPVTYVTITLYSPRAESAISFASDSTGRFSMRLPEGTYTAYSLHFQDGRTFAFLRPLRVMEGVDLQWQVNLLSAVRVTGAVTSEGGEPAAGAPVAFERNGAPLTVTSGTGGTFLVHLPPGQYRVWSLFGMEQYTSSLVLTNPAASLKIGLRAATPMAGRVFYDLNGDDTWDPGEGLEGVRIDLVDTASNMIAGFSGVDGDYEIPLLDIMEYTLAIEEQGFNPVSLGPLRPSELAELGQIQLVPKVVGLNGQLTSSSPLDLGGILVKFLAVGAGATTTEVTASSGGAFLTELRPGLYDVVIDAELAEGVRLQNVEPVTLRVRVGKSLDAISINVVKRVSVQGYLTILKRPFEGNLSFLGPEVTSTEVSGSFSHFLQPGEYTLHAASTSGAQMYVLLDHLNVVSPTNISESPVNITSLSLAATVAGVLRVNQTTVAAGTTLEFEREDGATLATVTGRSGAYEIALSAGSYEISLDWRGLDAVDRSPRFVRYALSQQVILLSGDDVQMDLTAIRTLDNATVSGAVRLAGQPASARITFEAVNETALTATINTSGTYDLSLAPGTYNVYAFRESGKTVSLTGLVVVPYVENAFDVILETGWRVSGIADLIGTKNEKVTLRFTAGTSVQFTTDKSGFFEVYLPARKYEVKATSEKVERGLDVAYTATTSLDLKGSTTLNVLLRRVDVLDVKLEWDSSERVTVLPGGQVVYTISVKNSGNLEDEYIFAGTPINWDFKFEPPLLRLPFGQGNVATTRVIITAPADAQVEHPGISVDATSISDSAVRDVLQVEVDVAHLRGVDLRLSGQPPVLSPEALEYQVQVANSGNGKDDFSLTLLNIGTLVSQGWRPTLIYEEVSHDETVENVTIPGAGTELVTLRLEAIGPVSTARALLRVHSQEDSNVASTLSVQLSFPSLTIPPDGVDVRGKNIQLTPPEFPYLLYALIAAVGVGAAILFLRRRKTRRRRR